MSMIQLLLSHPVAERLGWALVYFLWQGVAVVLLLAVVLWLLRRRSAGTRYVIACAALAAMAALPALTFCVAPRPVAERHVGADPVTVGVIRAAPVPVATLASSGRPELVGKVAPSRADQTRPLSAPPALPWPACYGLQLSWQPRRVGRRSLYRPSDDNDDCRLYVYRKLRTRAS